MPQAAIVGALLILRGAEGILNGTNTTLGDDDWTASLGLAIGLSIPVGICLIPCAFVISLMVGLTINEVTSSNDGAALAFPCMCALCCFSGILGLVALVVGLVSIVPAGTQGDPHGLVLLVFGAVTVGMPLLCVVVHYLGACFQACVSRGDSDGDPLLDCCCAGCEHLFACICTPCRWRRMGAERARRREEEEFNEWQHAQGGEQLPYRPDLGRWTTWWLNSGRPWWLAFGRAPSTGWTAQGDAEGGFHQLWYRNTEGGETLWATTADFDRWRAWQTDRDRRRRDERLPCWRLRPTRTPPLSTIVAHNDNNVRRPVDALAAAAAAAQPAGGPPPELLELALRQNDNNDNNSRIPDWSLQRGLSFLAPNEFLCPITLRVMDDPVTLAMSGMTYERGAISEWLRTHPRRDPKTNVSFDVNLTFEANTSLLEQIQSWSAAPEQQQALVALESETEEKASVAATSEAAALRRELCHASRFAEIGVVELLRDHVWGDGHAQGLAHMNLPQLRALKVKADALQRKDAADAEAAAVLPASARDAAAMPEWIASSTREEHAQSSSEGAATAVVVSGEAPPSGETLDRAATTTLAQQRPAGLRRGASSGSAMLDAVLDVVGMAATGGGPSPSGRLSSSRLSSRAPGQNVMQRQRTREALEVAASARLGEADGDGDGVTAAAAVEDVELQEPQMQPRADAEVTVSIAS